MEEEVPEKVVAVMSVVLKTWVAVATEMKVVVRAWVEVGRAWPEAAMGLAVVVTGLEVVETAMDGEAEEAMQTVLAHARLEDRSGSNLSKSNRWRGAGRMWRQNRLGRHKWSASKELGTGPP